MAIKQHKPTTPGRRGMTSQDTSEITTKKPLRSLLVPMRVGDGRNNQGRITTRHRGGGARRFYRLMNFNLPEGTTAVIEHIEYDPNRSARIALLHYADGDKSYILAPDGLRQGDEVVSSRNADIRPGNCLPLQAIPAGTTIHNIEMRKGKGGQLVRSAGVSAQLMAKDGDYAQVKLPSGEVRKIHILCRATVGQVSNADHKNIKLGKAGRARWLGRRPHNRGVTMNPVDHPMGGGEGRTSGGRHPCSPWGQLAKGLKTRNNKRTDGMIIKNRKAKG